MFTLTVESERGEQLALTQNESNYQLYSVDGLLPPKAKISTASMVNVDGVRFKSSKLQERNIVLRIRLAGDIETNRINLYNFFKSGRYCKLYYKNGTRNIYCEGYVEDINGDMFTNGETIQVSLIIPSSYLVDANAITMEMTRIFREFEFPFFIEESGKAFSEYDEQKDTYMVNAGDVSTGVIITITAEEDGVINPVVYDTETSNFFKVNTTLNKGEYIVIDTNVGKKSVKKYINGVSSNILSAVESGSTWFSLKPGNNTYWFNCEDGALYTKVQFDYNYLYEGV